ncbi:MAG: GerMN domain-containing protein [Acidobacteria bacterium]|nr:GerMN domain-containing protein [Acidobacteriota bacterium]
METKKLVLISAAIVVAVVLLFALVTSSGSGEETLTADVSLREPLGTDGEEPIAEEEVLDEDGGSTVTETAVEEPPPLQDRSFLSEGNRRTVVLFFQKADSDLLATERRRIFLTASPADQAKQIIVALINGPNRDDLLPTLPPETRVLSLFIDRFKTAYVDLSDEVVSLHPGGSAAELATVFSVVNSLTYNLDTIRRVRILVGGEERETLKSHLDLTRDYNQDMSIVDRGR